MKLHWEIITMAAIIYGGLLTAHNGLVSTLNGLVCCFTVTLSVWNIEFHLFLLGLFFKQHLLLFFFNLYLGNRVLGKAVSGFNFINTNQIWWQVVEKGFMPSPHEHRDFVKITSFSKLSHQPEVRPGLVRTRDKVAGCKHSWEITDNKIN